MINCGTMDSLTKATAQPPHPAPVSLAPKAPCSLQTFTSSSNSGQLLTSEERQIKHNQHSTEKTLNCRHIKTQNEMAKAVEQCPHLHAKRHRTKHTISSTLFGLPSILKEAANAENSHLLQIQYDKNHAHFWKLNLKFKFVPALIQNTAAVMAVIHKVTQLL